MTNPTSAPADHYDSLWTALFGVTLILSLPAMMLASAIIHS